MYRTIDPVVLMSAGDMSSASKISSAALNIGHISNAAFQIEWTGVPVGKFYVEASLDGVTYSDLEAGLQDAAAAPGSALVNLAGLAVTYVRVSYLKTSGTGTLKVTGAAKGK